MHGFTRLFTAAIAVAAASACKGDSTAPPPAPTITSIAPATLVPGPAATAVISGSGFSVTASSNKVTIDGSRVTVTAASTTELTVSLPVGAFPCHDLQNVPVIVANPTPSTAFQQPMDPTQPLTLAVGASQFFDASAQASGCLKLPQQAGASYLFNVYSASNDRLLTETFQLGGGAGAFVSPASLVPTPVFRGRPAGVATAGPLDTERRAMALAHLKILERNRRIAQARGGIAATRAAALRTQPRIAALFTPVVGDLATVRVDDIDHDNGPNYCTIGFNQQARVSYVSPSTSTYKAVIYEDVTNTLYGQIQPQINAIGAEFDALTLAVENQYFGNPLAYDASLGNKGYVLIFLTQKVNSFAGGNLGGFVNWCDVLPYNASTDPAVENLVSNEASIFYALVPTNLTAGTDVHSLGGWSSWIRAVLPHETKHITSLAEKSARGLVGGFDEPWLEEATAQVASEIWARHFNGQAWKGNGQWATTVGCEQPITTCGGDHPHDLLEHYSWLYDYLSIYQIETPLADDYSRAETLYGGSWNFVRWAVDQYATDEATTLKAINAEVVLYGANNIVNHTGATSFSAMQSRWAMAMALAPSGVAPVDPQLTLPSWDQAGIFAGLNTTFPGGFPQVYPLVPTSANYGSFAVLGNVTGGGFWMVRLQGTQTTSQLVALKRADGTPIDAASTLRLGVVRVQ